MRLRTACAEGAFAILGGVRKDTALRVLQAREFAPLWMRCPEVPRREELGPCVAAAMRVWTDEFESVRWQCGQRIDGGTVVLRATLHV